jgi:hypothetical protein
MAQKARPLRTTQLAFKKEGKKKKGKGGEKKRRSAMFE